MLYSHIIILSSSKLICYIYGSEEFDGIKPHFVDANSLYNFDCMHKKLPRGNIVWDGVRGDGI
jgi:hypothetical protein